MALFSVCIKHEITKISADEMDTGKQHLRYGVKKKKKNSTALIVESGKNTRKKKRKNESIINLTRSLLTF